MNKFTFTKRRSVSTIIGGFIFLVILTAAFAAYIVMMQSNTDFLQTQVDVSQQEIQKIHEQFTIGAAYDSTDSNRLCVNVENTGSSPLEMMDLWISNKSSSDSYDANLFDIELSDAFIPVGSSGQILDNQPLYLDEGIYDIKAVSSSGTVQNTELRVFPDSPDPRLNVTVFVYPVNAASGQNVTLGMHVFNRANTTLTEVQPNDGFPTVDPSEAVVDGFTLTTPSVISRLDPDEDVLFLWDPEIVGGVGSKLNFTASAKAMVEGCSTSSFIESDEEWSRVKVVPGVRREILAKPELFVSFPNPFGDSGAGDVGLFSIVMQNPTEHPFKVSQVSVQILSPNDEDLVAAVTSIVPSSGWSEVSKNTISWSSVSSPITIEGFDIIEFKANVEPTNTITAPINTIIYNVYSSFGQFSKGPFTLGTSFTATAILNVYGNTTGNATGYANFAISDIPSGSVQRFNFTMANNGTGVINSGAFMLINVPPGLRDLLNATTDAGLSAGSTIEFDDGSMQVPVMLSSNLAADATLSHSFYATMPSISVPAHYVFTVVANGTAAGGNVLIGPTAEIVVQVCPSAGCP